MSYFTAIDQILYFQILDPGIDEQPASSTHTKFAHGRLRGPDSEKLLQSTHFKIRPRLRENDVCHFPPRPGDSSPTLPRRHLRSPSVCGRLALRAFRPTWRIHGYRMFREALLANVGGLSVGGTQ